MDHPEVGPAPQDLLRLEGQYLEKPNPTTPPSTSQRSSIIFISAAAVQPRSRGLHYKMATGFYILLAFVIYMIARAFSTSRTPIPETSGKVVKVTSAAEFDALLKSTANVVVDFYADWCPPCRVIAPTFSELADNHSQPGRLAFAKVNVDRVQSVAVRYSVAAMPTFMFFRNGVPAGVAVEGPKARPSVHLNPDRMVDMIRGADKAALQAAVQALVAGEKMGLPVDQN